jgi:hypothetical protein
MLEFVCLLPQILTIIGLLDENAIYQPGAPGAAANVPQNFPAPPQPIPPPVAEAPLGNQVHNRGIGGSFSGHYHLHEARRLHQQQLQQQLQQQSHRAMQQQYEQFKAQTNREQAQLILQQLGQQQAGGEEVGGQLVPPGRNVMPLRLSPRK